MARRSSGLRSGGPSHAFRDLPVLSRSKILRGVWSLALPGWRILSGAARSPFLSHLRRWRSALVAGCIALSPLQAQTAGENEGEGGASIEAPPAEQFAVTEGGVDMRTGRYAFSGTDLAAGDMSLTRQVTNAVPGFEDAFGQLSHNWSIVLWTKGIDIDAGNYDSGPDLRVSVSYGGRATTFEKQASDIAFTHVSKDGYAILTESSGIYTFQNEAATIVFQTNGSCAAWGCMLASRVTLSDGTHYALEYETSSGQQARLRSVSGSRGFALLLEYGATGGGWDQVAKACIVNTALAVKPSNNVCPTGAMTSSYSYTSLGSMVMLASATNPANETSQFFYSGTATDYTMGFRRPGEAQDWLTNTVNVRTNEIGRPDHIVTGQDFVDGRAFDYTYSYGPQVEGQIPPIAGGYYIDNEERRVDVEYGWWEKPHPPSPTPITCCELQWQLTPGPVLIRDALGRETTMNYCDPNVLANPPGAGSNCLVTALQTYEMPEENSVKLERDWTTGLVYRTTQIAKPGSNLPNLVVYTPQGCTEATIKHCSKPGEVKDARGYQTDYTYSDAHGGVLTAIQPAVGGVRPQINYQYQQLTPALAGSVTPAPIWVLWREFSCMTSAMGTSGNCGAGAGDKVVKEYSYTPGNLFLLGTTVTANGETLRTCFEYDQWGRKISETLPAANLTSCS